MPKVWSKKNNFHALSRQLIGRRDTSDCYSGLLSVNVCVHPISHRVS
ncbi:uncharacterized protein METZ01_LOCUS195028, partial [marine metagenome]